jgi:hypothetical protein
MHQTELLAGLLRGLLFNPEDGDMFLRNFDFQRTTELYIPEGGTLEGLY